MTAFMTSKIKTGCPSILIDVTISSNGLTKKHLEMTSKPQERLII